MRGLRLAAITNIVGILVFSRGFRNGYLAAQFPEILGPWGWALIILWGLAYAAVARNCSAVPELLAVFALEKLVYTTSWIYWLVFRSANLPEIWSHDPLTASFLCSYGLIDFAFAIYFSGLYRRLKAR